MMSTSLNARTGSTSENPLEGFHNYAEEVIADWKVPGMSLLGLISLILSQ